MEKHKEKNRRLRVDEVHFEFASDEPIEAIVDEAMKYGDKAKRKAKASVHAIKEGTEKVLDEIAKSTEGRH